MKDDVKSLLPLAPAALHILAALASEDRHGYGIMQAMYSAKSQGHYKLGPGTLYDNLEKLIDRGLVDDAPRLSREARPAALAESITASPRSGAAFYRRTWNA